MTESDSIVIIGGSFAAISAVKSIYEKSSKNISITVVSVSTHSFFNVASPRLIVENELIPSTLFSVKDCLAKYAGDRPFRFVHGKAKSLNFESNEVCVDIDDGSETIKYDFLVIASGSYCNSSAFKLNGDYEETVTELKALHSKLIEAKKVAIVGGGATGVELAGEIATGFPDSKDITIYGGNSMPLAAYGNRLLKDASQALEGLGVKICPQKIESIEVTDLESKLTLGNGSEIQFDLVFDTRGVYPNSSFIPSVILDEKGYIITDEYLRVQGHPNVIALGDIVSERPDTLIDLIYVQMATFKATVSNVIFKENNSMLRLSSPKPMIIIPISKRGGVGELYGWKVPSFVVKFLKSKDFMISNGRKSLS